MKRIVQLLEVVAIKVVMFMGFGMFFAFTHWAAKYIHEYPSDLSTERVVGTFDSRGMNILVLVIFFGVVILLQKLILQGDAQTKRKRVRIFAIAWVLILGTLLSVWVSICYITPIWDQLQVFYGALEFHAGNFDLMDSYYNTYPHQYGLTFLYELFVGLCPHYRLFQYFNVVFIMVIVYFIYLITDELFHSEEISFYALIVTILFVPLPLYVNFVYGELWNMAFGIVAIWAVLRRLSVGGWKYSALAVGMMTIAIIARKNVVVWAIALMLMLLVYAIKHLNIRMFALAILIIAVPMMALEGVHLSYELRSGKEIGPGSPDITTIAMGLQERWEGPGYYSGYNNMVFINDAGRDVEIATQIAMGDIKERLQEFAANPAYARDFFQRKIWQQWNEGTYNSLIMTCTFEQEPGAFVNRVYYGDIAEGIYKWCNYYLFVIYFYVMIYTFVKLVKERNIQNCILVIALIGGLLFSIIWETKARYMFPYTILMFPCMAQGIDYMKACIVRGALFLKNKFSYGRAGK